MVQCPECSTELVERDGRFGEFLCCPKGNHGTFSIQDGIMYFKGSIGQMMKDARVKEAYYKLSLESISSGARSYPSLSQLMNAQMAQWGWNSSEEMEQLSEFAMGNPDEIWDDEERNDPSAWWNQRPY